MSEKAKRIILCCGANGRAIVVGDVKELPKAEVIDGQMVRHPVEMTNARMVLYWHEDCGGLFGLSQRGPKGTTTRITHATPTVCETVWQEWLLVSDEAKKAIDEWPAC